MLRCLLAAPSYRPMEPLAQVCVRRFFAECEALVRLKDVLHAKGEYQIRQTDLLNQLVQLSQQAGVYMETIAEELTKLDDEGFFVSEDDNLQWMECLIRGETPAQLMASKQTELAKKKRVRSRRAPRQKKRVRSRRARAALPEMDVADEAGRARTGGSAAAEQHALALALRYSPFASPNTAGVPLRLIAATAAACRGSSGGDGSR